MGYLHTAHKNDLDTTVLSSASIPETPEEEALAVGFVVTQQVTNKQEAKLILEIVGLLDDLQEIRKEQKRDRAG